MVAGGRRGAADSYGVCEDVSGALQAVLVHTDLPYGVSVDAREGKEKLFFVQNFNPYEVSVKLKKAYRNVETKERTGDVLVLEPYSCQVLGE